MDAIAFQRAMADLGVDVPRETLTRLGAYAALVAKWQAAINLVGPATLPQIWERHFLDSAQLLALIEPSERRIADFGSGAGFPGLVLAIMSDRNVDLIEAIPANAPSCARSPSIPASWPDPTSTISGPRSCGRSRSTSSRRALALPWTL
jgi:hypothetical protein